MTKTKFKTYYDVIGEKEGTTFTDESLTNQDSEKETNINCMLQKYGMSELVRRTTAKEELAQYVDLSNVAEIKTLDEVIKMRNQMTEYYKQLPSFLRKKFGDNEDIFIEKFEKGEFDDFINGEIITKEIADSINEQREFKKLQEKEKIKEQIRAEIEAKQELEVNNDQKNMD